MAKIAKKEETLWIPPSCAQNAKGKERLPCPSVSPGMTPLRYPAQCARGPERNEGIAVPGTVDILDMSEEPLLCDDGGFFAFKD